MGTADPFTHAALICTLAAPGAVWLVSTNHHLAQLDMKASMLQQEIERFRVSSALDRRELALGRPPTPLTLRWAL